MKRTHKRDDLIRVGRDLIVRQGFNATGLSDILTTAGVPKGSFYYYFESKEDFGLAIIEDFACEYQAKLDATISNQQLSPLTRLTRYFEHGIDEMVYSHYRSGCLIGILAQELSAQNEPFRVRLNQILNRWETQLADCIEAAYQSAELDRHSSSSSTDLAKFILSGWQGAMLLAKVTRSSAPLHIFIQVLFEQTLEQTTATDAISA